MLHVVKVMTEYAPHSHIPYGKDGSGYYSDNTIGVFNVMEAAKPMILNALAEVPCDGISVFTIGDYGTADGGVSMSLMTEVVEHLRQRYGDKLPVQVVYEDQPINDFKSLFIRVHGLHPSGSPSYLQKFDNVYVFASGTNFFSTVVPPGTLDLGFSSTAMHWLSKRPCSITGAIHHTDITVPEERSAFQKQASEDWESVLLARAKELKSGGRFIIVCFCVDKEGQYLGNTKEVKINMFQHMTSLWKQMVTDGKITQEEFNNTNFNNYYRTVEEYAAPFNDPDSSVSRAGLKLVTIETKVVRCPYREKWLKQATNDVDAKHAFAAWYIPTLRTWSNSTFTGGLSKNRTEQEKVAIVDEFFKKYEDSVIKSPDDHGMDYVHAYIDILKE